ncbi:hypothetical protein [Streptomyces sp. NPDC006879]|uniref:hypothetical protein n=1 Tax=Streptomyces sp. NPDC006879 TaxID=3364767 RepID=UPI0036BB5F7D
MLENHLVDTTLAEVRELWAQGAEDLGKTPGWVAKCWREKAVAVALAVALLLGGFIAAGAAGGSDVRATSERYDFLPEYTAPEPHSGTTWQLRTLATDDILVYRAPASLSSDDQAELLRVDEGTTLTLDCRAKVQKATFLKVSGSRTDYINVKSLSGPGSPDVSHLPECTTH